jgi:serine/threonine protein kinase
MGVGSHANVVYVIDFGLSKEYRCPNTYAHIPFKKGLGFTGTLAFASINSHLGLELGRRDDLESLAYMLFYFLWGFLPWQGLGLKEDDIVESKRGIATLPLFQRLPLELRMFFDHCRSLSFEDEPDYDHFFNLFDSLLVKEGFEGNVEFDWDLADANIPERAVRTTSTAHQNKHNPSPKRRMG